MFVKLITLFALLAIVSSVQGVDVVTTHFNDSTCTSDPIAVYVDLQPCRLRSVQGLGSCMQLEGDYYYLVAGCTNEPTPVADWQLITISTSEFCNDTYPQYIQVPESKPTIVVVSQGGSIGAINVTATCYTNGELDYAVCLPTADCASATVPTGECVSAGMGQYLLQDSCVAVPVAEPVATPATAEPITTPVSVPAVSTPTKTPTKTSSASVVAGSALFVTLLALF